jgi:hypothetical protein
VTDPEHSLLTLDYDATRNLMRVRGCGHWTGEMVERQIEDVRRVARDARRQHGYIRLLADLRGAGLQTRAVAAQMRDGAATIYRSFDRLAFVISSSILRIQLEASKRLAVTGIFTDGDIAERWLMAHDTSRSGPMLELEWGPPDRPVD